MATYFAPIGNGLGDLIVSLPAVQYLIDSGEPTILVLRSPRQEGLEGLIPGLSGSVKESEIDPDTVRGAGHRWINLREHPLQTDHVWGSSAFDLAYPGYKIADIVRDICSDMGIHADFEDLTPLPFDRRKELEHDVVLVPAQAGCSNAG